MHAPTFTRREWLATVGAATAAGAAARAAAAFLPTGRLRAAEAKPMRGAFMIMSTPYTAANEVDYDDLASQVDFLDRCGVHGLVWPQNSSEQRYLTKAERLRGFDVLAEAAKGRRPALVLGVQGSDTPGMLEYARHAEALAPDGMIAIPPTEAATLAEFRDYYAALCGVTGRPIFFQTSGGAPDVVPTVDFMVGMAREFPNLAYVKEERAPVHERMLALRKHRPDPVKSIFGAAFGRQWLYEMRLGMDGVMTGGAMYADIYARLWELHEARKHEELRDLFGRLLLMLNLDRTIPGIRLYVLKARGIFKTTMSRRGEYSFTQDQIAEIEYRLDAIRPYFRA
ncbi:MAG: dihydrodipicolinate synthase family protein [Acidobacteria bacterium]|nr:dihydrodipicolinate synthase family protein [Acidobacteriota bacterium]